MRYAILSDIHANWEALETAVDYAKDVGIQKWIVLGDTVGYGADPNACFDWVLKNASVNLMGNHEKAVIDLATRQWFNPYAKEAIEWTEQVLDPELRKEIKDLQYLYLDQGLTFSHGSPYEAEKFRYLMSFEDAKPSFDHMENSICFVGHTHVPCCFCEGKKTAQYLKPGTVHLDSKERYILNPGSVGQPRDHDSRLAFAIYDEAEKTFETIRLKYDNQKAAQKIRKAGLPSYLADRLL